MSWGLVNPWALLALGALALPLAIHLLNRHRGQRVWVGNIALYRQPRRQRLLALRLYQPGLLALRLLVLSLLGLLLAGLTLTYTGVLSGAVAYVTPSWWQLADEDTKNDLLAAQDRVFFLVPGFPEVTRADAPMPEPSSDVCSLLLERTAEQRHPDTLTVYGVNRAGQLPPKLCPLGEAISWHWLSATTDSTAQPVIDVAVFYHPQRADDAYAFEAALLLIDELRGVSIRTTLQPVAVGTDAATDAVDPVTDTPALTTAQMAEQPPHRRVVVGIGVPIADSNADVVITDRLPSTLLNPADATAAPERPRIIALDRQSLADSDFPDRLLLWLLGAQEWQRGFMQAPVAPDRVLAQSPPALSPPGQPMTPWLALLVALLLLIERLWSEWYSGGKRQ